MRLDEGFVNNNNSSTTGYSAVPLSEGRMRLQEQSRYSSSLEANISRGTDVMAHRQQQQPDRSPKFSSASGSSGKKTTATSKASAVNVSSSKAISGDGSISSNFVSRTKASVSVAKPKNPFDDEQDDNASYDESKNPFADELNGEKVAVNALSNKETKPFDEYDNNLNPFAWMQWSPRLVKRINTTNYGIHPHIQNDKYPE